MNQSIPKSKYGICPLMSSTQMVPVPKDGNIQAVGQQAFSMQAQNAVASCAGAECQLWDDEANLCCHRSSCNSMYEVKENLRDISAVLVPASGLGVEPTRGNAYAEALNDSISKLTYLVENLFKNIKQKE